MTRRKLLLLCDKAREIMADMSSRFIQFREVLLVIENKADANGLTKGNTLLRAVRARGDRILQTAGHNQLLTRAVLRNRLLLPETRIATEIIKGDEGALRLLKPTGAGSLGGATVQLLLDGGRPARRAPRFASPGGWWWAVRAYARDWFPSALQFRWCAYPVGVTDEGVPLRVVSELAPITLGRDEFTNDFSRYHVRCPRFFFLNGFVPGQLEEVSVCKGALLIYHQELTTVCGPNNNWAYVATSSDKFVSRGRLRYLRSPSDQGPLRT